MEIKELCLLRICKNKIDGMIKLGLQTTIIKIECILLNRWI